LERINVIPTMNQVPGNCFGRWRIGFFLEK
jgi:hypothetical protein